MNIRRFLVASLAFIAVATALPAAAQDKPSRAEIGEIVKEYLLENPEVIEQAMEALQQKRARQASERQSQALVELGDKLTKAPGLTVVGNPDGDVTMVEFFDYNCGYCKMGFADLKRIIETDKNVRVVLNDYPILGADSVEAALVAMAVKEQAKDKGKDFFAFHEQLLMSEGKVGKERALEVAKDQGYDVAKVEESINSRETRSRLGDRLNNGRALGIDGTPSYVIGQQIVSGARGYDLLKGQIDSVRRCGKASCD